MTAVVDFMTSATAVWAALTPPSRPTMSYHHIDRQEPTAWSVVDRGFRWALPQRQAVAGETADRTLALIEWSVTAEYYVARTGLGFFAFASAVADESSQLARAIEGVTSWPAGVVEVLAEPAAIDESDPDGAIVLLSMTVLTEDS